MYWRNFSRRRGIYFPTPPQASHQPRPTEQKIDTLIASYTGRSLRTEVQTPDDKGYHDRVLRSACGDSVPRETGTDDGRLPNSSFRSLTWKGRGRGPAGVVPPLRAEIQNTVHARDQFPRAWSGDANHDTNRPFESQSDPHVSAPRAHADASRDEIPKLVTPLEILIRRPSAPVPTQSEASRPTPRHPFKRSGAVYAGRPLHLSTRICVESKIPSIQVPITSLLTLLELPLRPARLGWSSMIDGRYGRGRNTDATKP